MAIYSEILLAILVILTATITGNVLQQILQRSLNEPPIVFHWFPVIGSTIAYEIDPSRFFHECKAKVGLSKLIHRIRMRLNIPYLVW